VTYVWFDALINYISGIGWDENNNKFNHYWPANYHLMAKDIVTTHCVYWPTMLMACDIELPQTVFAHGWWLIDDIKMSKSLGNVIKPLDLANEYGSDSLRYYLMRNMVLGQDATFTLDSFIKRYNADLANDYGNVVNRVVVLITKYFDSKVPSHGEYNSIDKNLINEFKNVSSKISKYVEELKIHKLTEFILSLVRLINKYLEQKEPWKTYKEFPNQTEITATTLYLSIECIRICTQLLHPIMPNKTKIVLEAINSTEINLNFGEIKSGQRIDSISTLFPRIEIK
jgi:methionyl-tRNA synthetase